MRSNQGSYNLQVNIIFAHVKKRFW